MTDKIAIHLTPAEYHSVLDLLAVARSTAFEDDLDTASIQASVDKLRGVLGANSVYTCEHCGDTTPKRLWGPGWITCPSCKKTARTTAERRADALSESGD